MFLAKFLSCPKLPVSPSAFFLKNFPGGGYRRVLGRKEILLENISYRSIFCADYEYDIYFCRGKSFLIQNGAFRGPNFLSDYKS